MNTNNLIVLVLTLFLYPICVKSECVTDNECVGINGTVCVNNDCVCSSGFFLNQNTLECIRVAPYITSPCTETIECQRLYAGYRCDNETNTCLCNEGFRYIEGRCWPIVQYAQPCVTKNQCYNRMMPFSLDCVEGLCACAEGYYRRQLANCRKIVSTIGGACILDSDCQIPEVPNAKCLSMKCANADANILSYPPEHINSIEDVSDKVTDVSIRALEGEVCSTNADCSSLLAGECSAQRHCICKRGYYPSPDKSTCLAELGQPITNARQCVALMGGVVNSVCDCPNGFFYNEESFLKECIKPTRNFNDSCADDSSCYTFGVAGICVPVPGTFFKVCDCDLTISIKDEERLLCNLIEKEVGDSCTPTDFCPSGSECYQETCRCINGNIPLPGNVACVPSEIELGDVCYFEEQCVTSNSTCNDGICTCKESFIEENYRCKLGLGGECSSIRDCDIAYSDCVEVNDTLRCTCLKDFVSEGNEKCLRKLNAVGDHCESSIQCWENIGGEEAVACESGQCMCRENHHELSDVCWKTSELDEPCLMSQNCYLGENQYSRTECRNGFCRCKWDYVRQYSPDACGGAEKIGPNMLIFTLLSILYVIYVK